MLNVLTNSDINLLCHTVDMEISRLSKLQSKAKDIKKFNDGYKNHIEALHHVKQKLQTKIK